MEPERLLDLLFNLTIIPIAAVVNYYVMRRIIRQDVKKLILDRVLGGEEANEFKKLVSTINRALEGEELVKVKKGILKILEIDDEDEPFVSFPELKKEEED